MLGEVIITGGSAGGTEVAPMNVENIRAKAGNNKVTLNWEDPEDTIVQGETLCKWKGTKVVQKLGSYPTSVFDGTLIIDNQVRNAYNETGFEITNLINEQTYYYAFFPYSEDGAVNKKVEQNSITATLTAIRIYGIKRALNSTSSQWERTDDAVGLVANATKNGGVVQNDFDSIYPWSDIKSYNYDEKTQTVNAYIGDATFKFDGSNGNVYTEYPEFYWKRWQDDNYEYIQIANMEVDGFIKSDKFSPARYPISGLTSSEKSKSGVAPLRSTTRADFRTGARSLGTNIGIMDWRYFLLQILYLVEYADYNSQNTLGYGICSGSVISSGGCDSLGMKSGCVNNDKAHSVIYRGVEDIFGHIFQWIDGLNINNYQTYICYDPTKYVDNSFSGNYQKLGYVNYSSDGYVSKLGYDLNHPLISMPTQASGSDSTYMCDYYWRNSGQRVVCVGGFYGNGTNVGLWCWSCVYSSSYTYSYIGARLLRY